MIGRLIETAIVLLALSLGLTMCVSDPSPCTESR